MNIVFLDKDTKELFIDQKSILILSPSLYWFTKEKLDISLPQAKKVAPSLFEGVVPEGKYSYYVVKMEDEYWFFAYEDKKIFDKLSSLGVKLSLISKAYPAQLALKDIYEPIEVDGKYLINDRGHILLAPSSLNFKKRAQKLQKSSLFLPKQALPLKLYSGFSLSEESLKRVSLLLLALIFLYEFQLYIFKKDLWRLEAKRDAIIKKYRLPSTSFELKSILHSLEKINSKQLKLREVVDYILRTPLKKDEFFIKANVSKKIHLQLQVASKQRAKAIERYLAKEVVIEDIALDGKKLFIKCKI